MKFYGREKQRKDLHRLFLYEGMQLGLIYGRRRVGKSELIKQSLRETDATSSILNVNRRRNRITRRVCLCCWRIRFIFRNLLLTA